MQGWPKAPSIFTVTLWRVVKSTSILVPWHTTAHAILHLTSHYAIHLHSLHWLIIQEQLWLYDCPHFWCFCCYAWTIDSHFFCIKMNETISTCSWHQIWYLPFGLLSCWALHFSVLVIRWYLPFGLLSCCVALQQPCDMTLIAALSIGGSQFHASTAIHFMYCVAKEVCLQRLCSYPPFRNCTDKWLAALTTKELEVG